MSAAVEQEPTEAEVRSTRRTNLQIHRDKIVELERSRDEIHEAIAASIIEEEQAVLEALRREGPDYGPLRRPVPCLFSHNGTTGSDSQLVGYAA